MGDIAVQRGSLKHEFWKRRYAQKCRERGYRVKIEAAREGGRVDILAWKPGEIVGIEIETGKSLVVANVRNGLRSGFDRVVVVCGDRTAFQSAERALGVAGLLIPGRVEVTGASAARYLHRTRIRQMVRISTALRVFCARLAPWQ